MTMMQEKKPTKYYSDRQESMVASYLGWKKVAASGARPFHKGDVESDEYVAECKTATHNRNAITFRFEHFDKICIEAESSMRKPVLITDIGTQRAEDSWVMVKMILSPDMSFIDSKDLSDCIRIAKNRITFNPESIRSTEWWDFVYAIKASVGDTDVLIMPLSTFKRMVNGEFDDD